METSPNKNFNILLIWFVLINLLCLVLVTEVFTQDITVTCEHSVSKRWWGLKKSHCYQFKVENNSGQPIPHFDFHLQFQNKKLIKKLNRKWGEGYCGGRFPDDELMKCYTYWAGHNGHNNQYGNVTFKSGLTLGEGKSLVAFQVATKHYSFLSSPPPIETQIDFEITSNGEVVANGQIKPLANNTTSVVATVTESK